MDVKLVTISKEELDETFKSHNKELIERMESVLEDKLNIMSDPLRLLNLEETAQLLNRSTSTVKKYLYKDPRNIELLGATKNGKMWCFKRENVLKFRVQND